MPASSAECERGFSGLKRTKTDWRNRLQSSSITDLLTIEMYTPEVGSYDPTTAVDLWLKNEESSRSRRPHEAAYARGPNSQQDGSSDSEEEAGLEEAGLERLYLLAKESSCI